jgi:O-antigen ligase
MSLNSFLCFSHRELITSYNMYSYTFALLYKFLFLILFPLSILAPQGITLVTIGLGLVFFLEISKNFSFRYIFQENKQLILLLSSFLFFCLCSCVWSINPLESFKETTRLTLLFLSGYIVFRGMKVTTYHEEILKSLLRGYIIGLLILCLESRSGGAILSYFKNEKVEMFKYNKSTSFIVLFLPLLMMNWELYKSHLFIFVKRLTWILSFILIVCVIFLLESGASKLALAVGVIVSIFMYLLPEMVRRLFLYIIVLACFMGPFIIPIVYSFPNVKTLSFQRIKSTSFYDRLSIWTNVSSIIFNKSEVIKSSKDRSLFGFGLGSSKAEKLSQIRCAWEMPPLSKSRHHKLEHKATLIKEYFKDIKGYLSNIKSYLRDRISFLGRNVKKTLPWSNSEKNSKVSELPAANETFKASLPLPSLGHCIISNVKAPIYSYPVAITEGLPLHPHNFILQVTLELGFIGTFFLLFLAHLCIQGIFKLRIYPLCMGALAATFSSFLIIASISYGIWQSWWICTLWLVAATSQLSCRQLENDKLSKT